jgi:RNA recognition motif-containing protein
MLCFCRIRQRETATESIHVPFMDDTRLFVGNLSAQTTENELRALFEACGPVAQVKLITDRMTGLSRGFAFITMATDEGAAAALGSMPNKELHGRNISVDAARPREDGRGRTDQRPAPRSKSSD